VKVAENLEVPLELLEKEVDVWGTYNFPFHHNVDIHYLYLLSNTI
jgi:hypothetical protein